MFRCGFWCAVPLRNVSGRDDLALVCAYLAASPCWGLLWLASLLVPPCTLPLLHKIFPQPPQFIFTIHTSLCCHHPALGVGVFPPSPPPSHPPPLLRLLCYGCFVWGGFGLAAGLGFPWLGLVALLCLLLPVLLCADLVWCPCVLGVTLVKLILDPLIVAICICTPVALVQQSLSFLENPMGC